MAHKHTGRCSPSLVGRKVQSKTTVRPHRTPARMARRRRQETASAGRRGTGRARHAAARDINGADT